MTKREFLDIVFALAPTEANTIMDAFDEYVESNVVPTGRSRRERGMSKYIIEIPDDVQYVLLNGKADNKYYTAVRPVEELEILNSDYINENFGELQDEAYKQGYAEAERIWRAPSSYNEFYQKGFEDGKNSIDMGCEGCKYTLRFANDEPCKSCSNCYKSKYEPMPKEDDRIEVGDEVISDTGTKFTVTGFANSDDVCGFSARGLWCFNTIDKLTKTGKHYDIASILEAMRK